MGAAVTKNVLSITTDVVASISTKVILKTELSTDTSQVISVKNIHGDVHITGNKFYQTANLNMKALMRALSSESAQQELMVEITQAAKSLASGINLGQYTDAQNLMNLLVKSTINLITDMETSCKTLINQDQEIIVERVKGNVYIQNNIFSQVSNIIEDCVQKATTESDSFQQLEEKLKQEASAKSEGISEWILVALLAVFIGVPVIGGVVGGKYLLKFIFPLILIAGAILLVLYFTWTYNTIKVIGYSEGLQKLCKLTPEKTFSSSNSIQAQNTCVNQKQCDAYDWVSYSSGVKPTTPTGYLYSQVPPSCIEELLNIDPDKSPVTRVPTFTNGKGQPTKQGSIGDVYLDVTSSFWYRVNEQLAWAHMGTFVKNFQGEISWGTTPPPNPQPNQYFVSYDPTNPVIFTLHQYTTGKWVDMASFKGPGLIPNAAQPNVTGYKYKAKREWALYGGLAGVIVGAVGSIYMLYSKKEETNS